MWNKLVKFAISLLVWFIGFSMVSLGSMLLIAWLGEEGFSIGGFLMGFIGYLLLRPAAEYWVKQIVGVWKSEE
jgi:hypothetical protein